MLNQLRSEHHPRPLSKGGTLFRRTRYQYGYVTVSPRAKGPDVWVYRWREGQPNGASVRKSMIVGTVEQYATEAQALRAAEYMRLEANSDNPKARTVTFGALIDRYIAEEMPQRYSTRSAYSSYLRQHIQPKWRTYAIADVKAFAVREWLKQMPLSPRSRTHVRNLMRVLFNCAMLWELVDVQDNPMKLVRVSGASKREKEPRVLTLAEFHRLLEEERRTI